MVGILNCQKWTFQNIEPFWAFESIWLTSLGSTQSSSSKVSIGILRCDFSPYKGFEGTTFLLSISLIYDCNYDHTKSFDQTLFANLFESFMFRIQSKSVVMQSFNFELFNFRFFRQADNRLKNCQKQAKIEMYSAHADKYLGFLFHFPKNLYAWHWSIYYLDHWEIWLDLETCHYTRMNLSYKWRNL